MVEVDYPLVYRTSQETSRTTGRHRPITPGAVQMVFLPQSRLYVSISSSKNMQRSHCTRVTAYGVMAIDLLHGRTMGSQGSKPDVVSDMTAALTELPALCPERGCRRVCKRAGGMSRRGESSSQRHHWYIRTISMHQTA